MDREMAALWHRAERRVDLALAGIVACALWFVVLPLTVLLTDIRWGAHLSLALVAAVPIGLIFVRPFQSGLVVARAIEERDVDELARWRETSIPPVEPELLRGRLRRVHYPMLGVVAAAGAYVAILATNRRWNADYPAMEHYSLGIAMVAVGLALGAVVLMFEGKMSGRALQAWLAAVGWLVPIGVGLVSVALIVGRQDIAIAVAVRAMTAMAYVIFGLVGILLAVVLAALWATLAMIAINGSRIEIGVGSREVPEPPDGGDGPVAEVADPEFDATDVAIVREALLVSRSDYWLGAIVAAATTAIVGLAFAGLAGTPVHVAASAVLIVSLAAHIHGARSRDLD